MDTELVLRAAFRHALDYLREMDRGPVRGTASLESLRARLLTRTPEKPVDAAKVIDQLVDDVRDGLTRSTGGRFFGWVIGGVLPAALAADWLTAAWDQNAALYEVTPAAAVVEEACGAWLLDLLRLPRDAGFALVTGCQMAHVTCLAAARHVLLDRSGWDVERHGLYGAPPITILTGDQRHGSIDRALRLLGMGTSRVRDLPVSDDGELVPETLELALEECDGPLVVLLQAGDLNTGSFDRFSDLLPIARKHGAWTHVDGAFGLWVATSDEHRHFVDGVEGADSWAVDGHKWLNLPYDCGYAIVADREAHRRAMAHRASYLVHSEQARDPIDWTPEYSRRARGFATYAAIQSLGRRGIGNLVERSCRHARAIVDGAGRLPGVEVLRRPTINQGLLRFRDLRAGAGEADHDRRTQAVTRAIVASGESFFACASWRGMRVMRVSVSDWRTTSADVARVVRSIEEALEAPH